MPNTRTVSENREKELNNIIVMDNKDFAEYFKDNDELPSFVKDFIKLGNMYYVGRNREKDINKAMTLFQKATAAINVAEDKASKTDVRAHIKLGNIYGKRSDLPRAVAYYSHAVETKQTKETEPIREKLAEVLLSEQVLKLKKKDKKYVKEHCPERKKYETYNREERDKEAVQLLELVYNDFAHLLLGKLYEEGERVARDFEKAIKHYKDLDPYKEDEEIQEKIKKLEKEFKKESSSKKEESLEAAVKKKKHKKEEVVDDSNLNAADPSKSSDADEKSSTTKSKKHITVELNEFKPKVQPNEIDYSKVTFFKSPKPTAKKTSKYSTKKRKFTSPSEPKSKLSEPSKVKIGRWGEKFVFLALKEHYSKKPDATKIKDTKDGFELQAKDKKSEEVAIQVSWHNKEEESGKDKDITVLKTNIKTGHVKERTVEVKTTKDKTAHSTDFSGNEYAAMKKCKQDGQSYYVYRVFSAGTQKADIEKIKNPLDKAENEELEVTGISFKI